MKLARRVSLLVVLSLLTFAVTVHAECVLDSKCPTACSAASIASLGFTLQSTASSQVGRRCHRGRSSLCNHRWLRICVSHPQSSTASSHAAHRCALPRSSNPCRMSGHRCRYQKSYSRCSGYLLLL